MQARLVRCGCAGALPGGVVRSLRPPRASSATSSLEDSGQSGHGLFPKSRRWGSGTLGSRSWNRLTPWLSTNLRIRAVVSNFSTDWSRCSPSPFARVGRTVEGTIRCRPIRWAFLRLRRATSPQLHRRARPQNRALLERRRPRRHRALRPACQTPSRQRRVTRRAILLQPTPLRAAQVQERTPITRRCHLQMVKRRRRIRNPRRRLRMKTVRTCGCDIPKCQSPIGLRNTKPGSRMS